MARVGYQITQTSINNRSAALAVRLRNLAQDTQNFYTAITTLPLTAAPVSFPSGDLTTLIAVVGKMNTLAAVYYGTTTTSIDNFDTDLAVLRGSGVPG